MARGRMVSTNVSRDPELNQISGDAALLYLMTIPHLDRDGLIDGDATLLWATVAPRRMELLGKTGTLIDEWVGAGLVFAYPWKDGRVLFFKGFGRHNAGIVYKKEPPSRYPAPPGFCRTHVGLVPDVPALAASWAESVNPKSEYYRALMDAAGVPVNVATSTRRLQVQPDDEREAVPVNVATKIKSEVEVEVEEKLNSDGDVDQFIPPPHSGAGGDCQGGEPTGENGHVSAGTIQYAFTDQQLRVACYQMGSTLGLHVEWTGYERWLSRQPPGVLTVLLEWIVFYGDMPQAALERIESLTAVIRSCINKGDRAPLTGVQRSGLAQQIAHAIEITGEA